jgi:hypothetical protein
METLTELRENLRRELVRDDTDKVEWLLQAFEEYFDARISAAVLDHRLSKVKKAIEDRTARLQISNRSWADQEFAREVLQIFE